MERGGALVVSGQVTGVAVHADGDRPGLRFVRLQRRKGEVRILAHGTATDTADLKKQCGARAPLAVVFDTSRTLHRVVPRTGSLDEVMRQAFPGATLEQLHCTGWTEGQGTGLSMVRRDQVAPLLTAVRTAGFRIVSLHAGPWPLLHLSPLLSLSEDDRVLGGHQFTFQEGTLQSLHPAPATEETLRIGDEELRATHALAMAIAWEQLVPAPQLLGIPDTATLADQREERSRVWYERGLVGLAAALLLLLGTEQVLKAKVREAEQDPLFSANGRAELQTRVDDLRAQLDARKALAQQLGLTGGEAFARRAARLVEQVPRDVQLDRVALNPLVSALRERERPAVETQHVRIHGTCADGHALNSWMNTLRTVPGVRNVRLIAFTSDTPGKRPAFEIDLEG
jgi:Tfp pilus assembly protein PilN